MKVVLQDGEQDCLLACYSMILSYYGKNISLHELYDREMIPPDGLSVGYLNKLNRQNGMKMKGYKTKKETVDVDVLKELKMPVIIQWNNDHFVVVKKISRKKITIIDPAVGKIGTTFQLFSDKFSGYIISLSPTQDFIKGNAESKIAQALTKTFLNRNTSRYIVSIVIAQLVALIFSVMIRDTLAQRYSFLFSLGIIGCLVFFQVLAFITKQVAQEKANVLYEKEITATIFKGIFSRPILYFRNNTVGTIIEKINLKTGIRDNILLQILPAILNFLSVFLLIIYLGFVSLDLTGLLIFMSLLYLLISSFLFLKKNQANIEYMQKTIEFTSIAQEDLSQMDQIKAQSKEDETNKNWVLKSQQTLNSYNTILRIDGIANTFSQTFNYISVIFLIMIGVYFSKSGLITIADLILFQSGVSLFISAVSQVQVAVFEVSKLSIYGEKINDLLIQVPKRSEKIDAKSKYALSLKNVSYTYDSIENIFENINIDIFKGEKVAIVGESGAGKSTLQNILLGLYSYEGEIVYGYENFRDQVGVVLQSMSLRKGTVLENLVNQEVAIKADEIQQVLTDVNIIELVDSLPKKIYSQVFQNGKNVSGGQMQRLLIAKSLLNSNKLVFWDEAFSSLDNKNRLNIYTNVLQNSYYANRTIILVSHHLDVLDFVDRVIFVQGGKVEIDTHLNLYAKCEKYREFLRLSED
ncbi:ATP-binding cassette domain-containing protein [Vagococcus sp. BWB3-3]|uniref:ATP-binding cassette domain-containing protein n=1 Tax=Vagococcus allomyrinae TaxID=2794353 RepID=A0A940SWS0_9ENTE|nr:cysteine peptidase family C39 domain-containing protein [Vagococcus allomyrinae]MBP1042461.1 ATP-binding cassette domain-containing protein [Vagococcus allomyrinae]